jgi:hypothetical protein
MVYRPSFSLKQNNIFIILLKVSFFESPKYLHEYLTVKYDM